MRPMGAGVREEDIPQTRWATTIDGACIAYQDLGSGPVTLVVIHGWISHLEVYWEQPLYVRFLRRLSRDMRVLVFDKRGVGMSDRVVGTPDLGALMDDVRAVMDAAGVEKAALLGWGCPGPGLAGVFAATYPNRCICLISSGSFHLRQEPDYPMRRSQEEFDEAQRPMLEKWGLRDDVEDFLRYGYGVEPDHPPFDDPAFRHWNAKLARFAATPASHEAFMKMWYETDVRPVLRSVQAPTLVLYCRGDAEDEEWAQLEATLVPAAQTQGVRGHENIIWIDDPERIVSAIEEFIASVRHEEAELDRMLATVLFTDIVCSTDKACEVGDARWKDLLERHDLTVRAILARYRGQEVTTTGDGFLATFDGPARAVKCAQGICEAVKPLGLAVRAGCHTGEIEVMGADVGGVAVHIGARVAALAAPSEVLVSSTVKDLVAGSGLRFEDRGKHELKGVPEPWRLYAVTA